MKTNLILLLISTCISACGGGSGGISSSPATTPVAAPLAAYAGTWESACDVHERETATFAVDASGVLSIATKTEYFSNVGCTGAILATETLSANFSAVYAGAVDASVQLAAGAAATAIKVDAVNSSVPAYSMQISGPGVVRATQNGKPQWCINYGGGSQTCVNDDGVHAAATARGGLYLKGNQLYSLNASGSGFVVGGIYTKK